MSNFWPSNLNAKDYDPESREAIKIHEQMRQMTERIKTLEEKTK